MVVRRVAYTAGTVGDALAEVLATSLAEDCVELVAGLDVDSALVDCGDEVGVVEEDSGTDVEEGGCVLWGLDVGVVEVESEVVELGAGEEDVSEDEETGVDDGEEVDDEGWEDDVGC